VTLPETTQEEAEIAAQRLRSVVDDTPFHIPQLGMPVPVTLSIGVAMSGDEALLTPPFDHLFGRADAALYSAKNAGRNTVEISASAA
jgi:two-component system cell cycle response regulator